MLRDKALHVTVPLMLAALCALAPLACEGTSSSGDDDTDMDAGQDGGDGGADTDSDSDSDSDSDTDTYDGPAIPTTCEQAAEAHNSVGCEFFAVDLNNIENPIMDADSAPYAIVVSNPQLDATANVKIEDMRGSGGTLRTVPGLEKALAPGELIIFNVSCKDATKCPVKDTGVSITPNPPRTHIERSGFKAKMAFRLTADVPVLAYQWNVYGKDTFSTDASLLLPTTALANTYLAATWPWGHEDTDTGTGNDFGEVAMVGTQDGTSLTITPTADVHKAEQGTVPPAISTGATSPALSLNAFDVLQIAPKTRDADLSGSLIEADKPIAVFGSHPCANVPTSEWFACDHVEEQLMPLKAWGTDAVLGRYAVRPNTTEDKDKAVWRIVAGADAMTVHFDPQVDGVGAEHKFAKQGEVLEFKSPIDHYASATFDSPADPGKPEAPFFAYQLMTGRYWIGGSTYQWGDPMMILAPPAGQYLDRYYFATDNFFDYAYDQLILVRKAGYPIEVDCLGVIPDADFVQVGGSEWEVARVNLDQPGGAGTCVDGPHWAKSTASFGISVVGISLANSYGYPGGLGVRWINPVDVD
jgi:hypothetical protein